LGWAVERCERREEGRRVSGEPGFVRTVGGLESSFGEEKLIPGRKGKAGILGGKKYELTTILT